MANVSFRQNEKDLSETSQKEITYFIFFLIHSFSFLSISINDGYKIAFILKDKFKINKMSI